MLVHVYASYKRSPVGFQPGSFVYKTGRTDDYYLSFSNDSTLVYRIFEQGFVKKAKGNIPNTQRYLFLVKDIEYTYENHDEVGKDVYINIAFEFDKETEYLGFVAGYNSFDSAELPARIAEFVVTDKNDNKYALHIDAMLFDSFVKELYSKESTEPVNKRFELLTNATEKTRYDDQITNLFGVGFEKEGSFYYYPPKKKHILKSMTKHHQKHAEAFSIHFLTLRCKDFLLRNRRLVIMIGVVIAVVLLTLLLVPRIASAHASGVPAIETKSQTS